MSVQMFLVGGAVRDALLGLPVQDRDWVVVGATPEALATMLFGPRPYCEAVLAEAEGQAVGFALFFHNFSTFLCKPGLYLEDLFVEPPRPAAPPPPEAANDAAEEE